MTEEKTKLKRYRIQNRIINKWWEGDAESAQEACEKAGWPIGDCWVREHSLRGSGGWKKLDEIKETKK